MELQELGFSEWFLDRQDKAEKQDYDIARITAVNRDNYLLRNERSEVLAELSGEFIYSAESNAEFPVVGDWAYVRYFNSDTLAIVFDLFPRKTLLRRKTAGKKNEYQMIASNIDVAFIVQGCDFNFNPRRLERYLVMAYDGNIHPMVLLSKSDLVSDEELEQRLDVIRSANINCEIIAFSSRTGYGWDKIKEVLEPGRTYCLLGSSGVGKTTLLNHLIGRDAFETNLVREKDGKGRHTTSRRQLVVLENGAMIIDTPGMRELGNVDTDTGIDETFTDIGELAASCRFKDCTHTNESGCAVIEAVREGTLDEGRYQNYLKLLKESEHYESSYLEKRRKDRKLGQFFKTAKKDIKRFKKRS